jgi:N-carbamoyl-L-amino-acid hydrolase
MMGSLVHAGGLAVDEALATVGTDGTILGEELARIGYAGPHEPGFLHAALFVELHIEQGPVLEREGVSIGAVETLQGISWQRVTIEGEANHRGNDADGHAAGCRVWRRRGWSGSSVTGRRRQRPAVATVGCMTFEPNAINVIPSRATFTVDLRDPDEERLRAAEAALAGHLAALRAEGGSIVRVERLARFAPVRFDAGDRGQDRAGRGRARARDEADDVWRRA